MAYTLKEKPKAKDSYSDKDLSIYDGGFNISEDADYITANGKKVAAQNAYDTAVNTGHQYKLDEQYNQLIQDMLNRPAFSYDLNGDALYQQYKDKYIQQGKMAMQNTMGQAAAMTGGYGNSYAASVGNQAYQASLENLNDIVPELYQLAYDKYNQEGQDLLNKYSMLSDDKKTEYGMWLDKINLLGADRDYYTNEENNIYNRKYGEWSDNRTYDTNQYWNETNFGYGKYRDEVADWESERDFLETQRKWEAEQAFNKEKLELEKNQLKTPEPKPEDYSQFDGFNAGDWESYFAQIRQKDGRAAAENELNELASKGVIPKNMVVAASLGARGGSLGH